MSPYDPGIDGLNGHQNHVRRSILPRSTTWIYFYGAPPANIGHVAQLRFAVLLRRRCGGCGRLLAFASHARACFYRVMLSTHQKLICVLNGCVPLLLLSRGVERRSTFRPKTSVIAVSTAKADARIRFGRLCSGVDLSTPMVHLRPILAIIRWSCLPCFAALGLLAFGFCYPKRSLQRLMKE